MIKNIKQLKELIENLPDDMLVGLLDLTSDDMSRTNYSVNPDILDYVKEEDDPESAGKMLFFTFANKRAPNIFDMSSEEMRSKEYKGYEELLDHYTT